MKYRLTYNIMKINVYLSHDDEYIRTKDEVFNAYSDEEAIKNAEELLNKANDDYKDSPELYIASQSIRLVKIIQEEITEEIPFSP